MDPVAARIEVDEGERLTVYDDATGLPIGPGSHVRGKPTIGYGTLICAPGGITHDEALALLGNRIARARAGAATLPAYAKLDQVRQDVLVEMVFQIGLYGVKGFHNTLAAMERGDYAAAAAGMRASQWAKQTPSRAERLAKIMETGVAQ